MDRRKFVSKIAKVGSLFAGGVIAASGLKMKKAFPVVKHFKLQFPDTVPLDEAQAFVGQFWNLQEMANIESAFSRSKKILYTKHFDTASSFESVIGFASHKDYIQWEKAIANTQCCDDQTLNEKGFSFSTKTYSIG